MTRVATPKNEDELITMAKRMTVRHLSEHCKQRVNATQASTATAQSAHNARAFRVWHDHSKGTMHFSIDLPIEQGELLEKAIEKAAVQFATEVGTVHCPHDEEPSWSSRQADAIVCMARESLNAELSQAESPVGWPDAALGATSDTPSNQHLPNNPINSSSTADNYQVVVHVDESALVGRGDKDPDPSKNPGVGTVNKPENATSQYPIESVRRLCCDGSIIPIIENAKGKPLNVGRKVRTITTAIRRALWSRDKGCAYPGCHHTRFVDAHHIKHWADGGETSMDNLVLLCSSHHLLLHEGGYSVHKDHQGTLFFKRPDGKAVPDCGFYCDDWTDTDINIDTSDIPASDARAFGSGLDKPNKLDNRINDDRGGWSVIRTRFH